MVIRPALALGIALAIAVAACSTERLEVRDAATTSVATTASTAPLTLRIEDCNARLEVVQNNVRDAMEQTGIRAIVEEGSPAAAAAQIRAEVSSLNAMIDNFAAQCRPPECPDVYTPVVVWLRSGVAQIEALANTLEGGSSGVSTLAPPPTDMVC